jgi:mannose-6-phosphate isomerase-like protein (cupin superfamily)
MTRVIDSLKRDWLESHDAEVERIVGRFQQLVEEITAGNGLHLTQDVDAPPQAGFIVPNLGITILPLVYGDHHSWNLAYLGGDKRDVPTHRHHFGVEIHLGFNPTHGQTVLGAHRADVSEGYAMPIPPETDHGWVNTSNEIHHVPFIFGSLKFGGWGVFLDVTAQPRPVSELTLVPRDSQPFSQMVYLERSIAQAEKMASCWRTTLIPASVTNRGGVGGLELCLTRVNQSGCTYPIDEFRAVGIVRGEGLLTLGGIEQRVQAHDHFGIPAGMAAALKQLGAAPLVALDTSIRGR